MGYEQIQNNIELLKPGATFKELTLNSKEYSKEEFRHYSVLFHGVGLCDEFPAIPFSWELNENSFDGVLQPGMVMCVETYVGRYSGGPGVKLEEQVLITESGYELLTSYPFEKDLLS